MSRLCQCFLDGPSYAEAFPNHEMREPCKPRPLGYCLGLSIPFNYPAATSIVGLFGFCSPANILRFVIAFVVDSIQRVRRRWSRSHIIDKRLEGIAPLLADSDSSRSVSEVAVVAGKIAAMIHRTPNIVLRRFGLAVYCVALYELVAEQTSARLSPCFQRASKNNLCATAITETVPSRALAVSPSVGDNSKTPVSMSSAINAKHCWRF